MSILSTNLLPSQEKKSLQFEEGRRTVLLFSVIATGIFLVGLVFLVPSYIPVIIQRNNLEEQLLLEEQASVQLKIGETIQRVRSIKGELGSVRTSLSEYDRASKILGQFLDTAGPGIVIGVLTVKKEGGVSITGHAGRRRDLLGFEKILRDSNLFQEISLPLSNIIRETDVPFFIQANLKPQFNL